MAPAPLLLIVDDDPINHAIAGAALVAAGWQVERADDGAAAVAIADIRRYALILMDIQMPGLDGHGAARAIRSGTGANAATPILAFTATQQVGAEDAFRASGMDGHLAKPFTRDGLVAEVERWRPADAPARSATLVATFGAAGIAKLLGGFRDQLKTQLDAVDDLEARAGAHRLAGIAGTLGFSEVSRLWLAISEGDDTAYSEARISTRKALAEIDANPIEVEPNDAPDRRR